MFESDHKTHSRTVLSGMSAAPPASDPMGESFLGNSSSKLSYRPRSIYVGQGLGIKQDDEPAFNPKGSAKLILKEILRQHELENS